MSVPTQADFDRLLADLSAAYAEIKKLSARVDELLAKETEAVETLARVRAHLSAIQLPTRKPFSTTQIQSS
jgi:hypothetical protein